MRGSAVRDSCLRLSLDVARGLARNRSVFPGVSSPFRRGDHDRWRDDDRDDHPAKHARHATSRLRAESLRGLLAQHQQQLGIREAVTIVKLVVEVIQPGMSVFRNSPATSYSFERFVALFPIVPATILLDLAQLLDLVRFLKPYRYSLSHTRIAQA